MNLAHAEVVRSIKSVTGGGCNGSWFCVWKGSGTVDPSSTLHATGRGKRLSTSHVVPQRHSLAHPHALSYLRTRAEKTGGGPMSEQSEPWNDIETVLDAVRVEEEVQLAVLEALGELDDPEEDEFSWDDFGWAFAYGASSQ